MKINVILNWKESTYVSVASTLLELFEIREAQGWASSFFSFYSLTRKSFDPYLERSGLTEMLSGLKLFLLQTGKISFQGAKLKLQDKTQLFLCSKRKIIHLFVTVCLTLGSRNKNTTRIKHEQGQHTLSFVFPSLVFLSPLILQSDFQGGINNRNIVYTVKLWFCFIFIYLFCFCHCSLMALCDDIMQKRVLSD